MYMFFVILGVVAWVALAFWPASIAKRKGYSFWLFFILSVVLSWLLILIVTAALEDKNASDRRDQKAVDKVLEKEEEA